MKSNPRPVARPIPNREPRPGGTRRPRSRSRSKPRSTNRAIPALLLAATLLAAAPGCASLRRTAPPDLSPCTDSFARTKDGWNLGVRRYQPRRPDPGKLPVVLCHGLGLNGTFWTITDHHLPGQLTARGYDVFVVDLRAAGGSHRSGPVGRVNLLLRETPLPEINAGRWNVDHLAKLDIPAILDHVSEATGKPAVNWVGHSLGGIIMFPYLELSPEPERVHAFVSLGGTVAQAHTPQTQMIRANRGLRVLLRGVSTGRIARGMSLGRPPGLDKIDRLYYSSENVEPLTIDRFYGYTLEDPGRGMLSQLEPFLSEGRLLSEDGAVDYVELLGTIDRPILMVAGEGDLMADVDSMALTYNALGARDKMMLTYGRKHGHFDDYGHCDLVWSRHAPREIFPDVIDWLDARQPGALAARAAATDDSDAPGDDLENPRPRPRPRPQSAIGSNSASTQIRDQVSNRSQSERTPDTGMKPASWIPSSSGETSASSKS